MREHFCEHIVCPVCKGPMQYRVFRQQGSELLDGILVCGNDNAAFPLVQGIPILLPPETLLAVVAERRLAEYLNAYSGRLPTDFRARMAQRRDYGRARSKNVKTASWYAYMWKRYREGYEVFDRTDLLRQTGGLLDNKVIEGKRIIDVGAGQGRHTKHFLDTGAAEVVSVDLGDSIALAYERYGADDRLLCVQADIYALPFTARFDTAFLIGVLQHLEKYQEALRSLLSVISQRGNGYVWCYGQSTVRCVLQILRALCKPLTPQQIWMVAGVLAVLRYCWASAIGLATTKRSDGDTRYGSYPLHFLHVNTFDHLSARLIHFFSHGEIELLLREAGSGRFCITERYPKTTAASWWVEIQM